jgi:ATP-dependent Lon protease
MNRFSGRALVAVASLAMVVAMTHVADAQREGGPGGRGGPGGGFGRGPRISVVQLAAAVEVQAALNLNDEQKGKVKAINDDLRQGQQDLFQQGGGDFEEMRAKIDKLNADALAKLTEALDETQNKRLLGILAQVDVVAALNNAEIVKALNVTDEQKTHLNDIRDSIRDAGREAMEELRRQELSREEMRAKMEELRAEAGKEAGKKLLAALTSEQQSQYEALKGEPVEIDRSQFRMGGPGGRGGPGGPGRGGRGESRGRGGDRGDGGGDKSNDGDKGA